MGKSVSPAVIQGPVTPTPLILEPSLPISTLAPDGAHMGEESHALQGAGGWARWNYYHEYCFSWHHFPNGSHRSSKVGVNGYNRTWLIVVFLYENNDLTAEGARVLKM